MTIGKQKTTAAYLLLAATIAMAPVAYAAPGEQTQVAAAIGAEEPQPSAPTPTPQATQPTAPVPTTSQATPPPTEEAAGGEGLSKAEVWLGVGVAVFLAAVGGGGSTSSH